MRYNRLHCSAFSTRTRKPCRTRSRLARSRTSPPPSSARPATLSAAPKHRSPVGALPTGMLKRRTLDSRWHQHGSPSGQTNVITAACHPPRVVSVASVVSPVAAGLYGSPSHPTDQQGAHLVAAVLEACRVGWSIPAICVRPESRC